MQKDFEWKGKKYSIDPVGVDEFEEFLEIGERVDKGEMSPLEGFRAALRQLALLNLPDEVKLCAEEVKPCMEALGAAQFGADGGDEGNPEGGAKVH